MADEAPLSAPRILCLHGGGTNDEIFRLQLRTLISRSSPPFRYIFVQAPFLCHPHPAIIPYFSDLAPFRRWLRWLPDHEPVPDADASEAILAACREAIEGDVAGTGEWVGVLGFSQGAKIAMSLLWGQQMLDDAHENGEEEKLLLGVRFKLGIIHAARNPIVSLHPAIPHDDHVAQAGDLSSQEPALPDPQTWTHAVRTPTVHVHGLADPGLALHRIMSERYCAPGSARVVEWEGNHRLPAKTADVDRVLAHIFEVAESVGVHVTRPLGGSQVN